jgi:hypothetical protein
VRAPPLAFCRPKSHWPLSIADRHAALRILIRHPGSQRALKDHEMAFTSLAKYRRVLSVLAVIVVPSALGARAFAEDHAMTILAQASSGQWQCEIRKSEAGGSVELAGFIKGSKAVAGRFRFTVMKSSPSGTSNINQADKFDLAADKENQVGLVRMNLESAGQLAVELFVKTDDGVECRAKATL